MRVESISQGIVSLDEIKKIEPQLRQQVLYSEVLQSINYDNQIQLLETQTKSQKSDVTAKDFLKDSEELKKLMKELQAKLSYLNSQLKIEIDSEINQPVVKIMDINTNQVIRQIPPDYMINIIKNINKLLGVLFEEKA